MINTAPERPRQGPTNTPARHTGHGPAHASELPPQQDGVLVLNKPKGPTSAACIAAVKRRLGQKKIGHAGTLDPMASGVLLVLLGQATKLSGHLMDQGEKIYSGTACLGISTDTWDAEGTVTAEADYSHVTSQDVQCIISGWQGDLEQEVPSYSAAKHNGRPLYDLARKGLATPVKKKTVHISRAEIEWINFPHIRLRVACSSGTYIRSLAHSLGMRLGCGAMLTELTREYSHPFGIDLAHDLDTVIAQPESFAKRVLPLADALPLWPRLHLDEAQAALVRNGHRLEHHAAMFSMAGTDCAPGAHALMLEGGHTPLALAQCVMCDGKAFWSILRGLWN